MSHPLNPRSAAFRVLVFFMRNFDEELKTSDIATKFDIAPSAVFKTLTPAVRDDMLVRTSPGPGRGRDAVYSAGNALLTMIGENRMIVSRHHAAVENARAGNVPVSTACAPVAGGS